MKITFVDKDSFQVILRRVYVLFLNNTTPDFKSARSRPTIIFLLDPRPFPHEDTSKVSKTNLVLTQNFLIEEP